ncbi:hypothetical protein ACH34F_08405 [Elizabethkingia anophelis]|uniref:hypothetical protein n=1 Tax=Elizabethkingia anophelis TaxID=1117645 RepID=UPI0037870569
MRDQGNSAELKLKGFKVCEIISGTNQVRTYNRKDFFKICIFTGESVIHYSDKTYQNDNPILFFGNPNIPYSWELGASNYYGIACLFTEEFLKQRDRSESLHHSPLFKIGGTPVLELSNEKEMILRQYSGR